MKHPRCKSCGRAVVGRQHQWASIRPLCRNCYGFHCRNTIKRSNLIKKMLLHAKAGSTGSPSPRPRGFWGWLFG